MRMELRGKKILVVGLGRSGLAAARFCAEAGAQVVVCDAAPAAQCAAAQAALAAYLITFHFDGEPLACFTATDLVVASPGVPLTNPGMVAARTAGIPIVSEMELAVRCCATPIIAVSGTNGKSTTVTLIGEMLRAAGIPAVVGGNLGTPLLAQLHEAAAARFWVIEVSSYQLETTPSLRPRIAVMLNITPDHLDRYANFAAYAAAKALLWQSLSADADAVFNADDAQVVAQLGACPARRIPFTRHAPRRAQVGAWCADGVMQLCRPDARTERVDLRTARLTGAHNQENMMAAACAALCAGASVEAIAQVCHSFPGLPHRCQLVHEWHGVRFFDDSKGTNVGSVVKSLAGFSAPVLLLAGGLDKGAGYAELREPVRHGVKTLVLFGAARDLMQRELRDCTETVVVDGMAEAVQTAVARAVPGDVVLLSPACASFDQYRNYAERGDDFARWARHWTSEENR
ncbi:MAG: UDP-N-acetylmuramoyl-L-alanine--D-glutamate ligase [Deltaproteobacteria bacterium]|nr:UDP-N-acetylmuramoyl-L-alanine--D-glutamate ligase [Deltaproteobacteria bacterium]